MVLRVIHFPFVVPTCPARQTGLTNATSSSNFAFRLEPHTYPSPPRVLSLSNKQTRQSVCHLVPSLEAVSAFLPATLNIVVYLQVLNSSLPSSGSREHSYGIDYTPVSIQTCLIPPSTLASEVQTHIPSREACTPAVSSSTLTSTAPVTALIPCGSRVPRNKRILADRTSGGAAK